MEAAFETLKKHCLQNKRNLLIAFLLFFLALTIPSLLAKRLINQAIGASSDKALLGISYSRQHIKYGIFPKIVLEDAYNNLFSASKVEVHFKLLSLMTGNFKPSKISVQDAIIDPRISSPRSLSEIKKAIDTAINMGQVKFSAHNLSWGSLFFKRFEWHGSSGRLEINASGPANLKAEIVKKQGENILDILVESRLYSVSLSATSKSNTTEGRLALGFKNQPGNKLSVIGAELIESNGQLFIKDVHSNLESEESEVEDDQTASNKIVRELDELDLRGVLPTLASTAPHLGYFTSLVKNLDIRIKRLLTDNLNLQNVVISFAPDASHELTAEIEQGGNLKVRGSSEAGRAWRGTAYLTHTDVSKLTNIFDDSIIGKPIALLANLYVSPFELAAEDLECKLGDGKVSGSISRKNIAGNNSWGILLKLSQEVMVPKALYEYYPYLERLVTKSYEQEYTSYFAPIQDLQDEFHVHLILDNATNLGRSVGYADAICSVSQKQVICPLLQVSFDSGLYAIGDGSLLCYDVEPRYKLNISETRGLPEVGFDSILQLKSLLQNGINLAVFNIDTSIKASELKYAGQVLKNFSLRAHNVQSILAFDEIKFDLLGGNLNLNGSIESNSFIGKFGYLYEGLNLANIFAGTSILPGAKGVINTNGTMSFSGDTLDEIFYSTSIAGRAFGVDISVPGVKLEAIVNSAKDVDALGEVAPVKKADLLSGYSNLGQMDCNYEFFKGKLVTRSMVFDTGNFTTSANIDYDTYTQTLGLQADFKQTPRQYFGLPSKMVRLKASGPITTPTVSLEYVPYEKAAK